MAAAELDVNATGCESAGQAAVEQAEEQQTDVHPFIVSATELAAVCS